MKLALGTVQFGMDYGISNNNGKPLLSEVIEILDLAAESGVLILDTAQAYGDSEQVLGKALPKNHSFKIVTKTKSDLSLLREDFQVSLENMKQTNVYALMGHDASSWLNEMKYEYVQELSQLKTEGLVTKIGVSIYTENQLERVLQDFSEVLDIIQVPLSVIDQRLLKTDILKRLKDSNVEIHVRSVFLQGLLLMSPEKRVVYFDQFKPELGRYDAAVFKSGVSPLEFCYQFVGGIPEIDHIVCGVSSLSEFQGLLRVSNLENVIDYSSLQNVGSSSQGLLNPSC